MYLTSGIHFTSDDSAQFFARPICADDKGLIQQGFSELTERSKYLRFFAVRSKLTLSQLMYFTEIDGKNHVAWGIIDESKDAPRPVGIGRFVRLKDEPDVAEIAIAIVDIYQGKGMGRVLFAILNIVASMAGIKRLRYHVLEDNQFVIDSLNRFNLVTQKKDGEILIAETNVLTDEDVLFRYPKFKILVKQLVNDTGD